MRDLDLWRRLDSGAVTPADLAGLAALPLGRRCAYVGAALRLTAHPDAAMRAAALAVLAGSRGVEGVRTIVAALDDADERVRGAALEALRETARDAPVRFTHALFHTRPDVRLGAVAVEPSQPVAELANYLRADPVCRELATKHGRWTANAIPLAFDLYADGHLAPAEFVDVVSRDVRALEAYLVKTHQRDPDVVTIYIHTVITDGVAGAAAPPGIDQVDHYVKALAAIPVERRGDVFGSINLAHAWILVRRVVVALLAQLSRDPSDGTFWSLAIALEPNLLAMPDVPAEHIDAIVAEMLAMRAQRLTDYQVQRLLPLSVVAGDLALAAALVSRAPSNRLELLAEAYGEGTIVERLFASDRGWREICSLPHEKPAYDVAWLQQVEKRDYKRYVALAAIAAATYTGARQSLFVEGIPPRHRPAVFQAAMLGLASATGDRVLQLCRVLARRIDRAILVQLLPELLDRDTSGRLALGLVRYVDPAVLGGAARDLSPRHVATLVARLDEDPAPRDRELALARTFTERGLAEVADWCARVDALLTMAVAETTPLLRAKRALTAAEERAIAGASGRALDVALAPAIGGHVSGLVRALDRSKREPHVWACVALLGCADRLEDVARLLDTFSEPTNAFAVAVDNAMASMAHAVDLPPLARARLWRWERQLFGFLEWVEANGGPLRTLLLADSLRRDFARATLWQATSEALMLIRYRARPRFEEHASLTLAQYCADRVDQPIGRHAARIVVALVEAGTVPVHAVRDRVLDRVADTDGETRSYVARLIRLEGVPEAEEQAAPPPVNIIDDIRTSTDLDALARWCFDSRGAVVQEAALALVALGAPGQLRIAEVLVAGDIPTPTPILATVVLWDHAPALDAVRDLACRDGLDPSWQFHLALALLHRGERDMLPRAIAAIRSTAERWYFRRADWDALVNVADIVECSLALTDAPHHHAYHRAVNTLLSLTRPTAEVHDALVRFLEIDSDRPLQLRIAAARYIARHWGDARGLPLLVEEVCDPRNTNTHEVMRDTPDTAVEPLVRAVVDAALVGGDDACGEPRMWFFVESAAAARRLPTDVMGDLQIRIFENSSHAPTRRSASYRVLAEGIGDTRVRMVAEVFAWGVKRGVELCGRMLKFHMTSTEKDLGHTRLDGNHIFVSPLPMLRGEAHGRDIVEGLVLHEIGHHVYHRGEKAQALWKRAHNEGIGHFLNLIADEHLERNLRAVDASYGDRLKRLGAYAFQHAPQEMKVGALCESLGAATAPALIAAELNVAFDETSVRLRRGAILGELDRLGHPVARFSRSLRMGLGNRAGDPLNGAALALCGKDLRALDMQGLYDLTRKLCDLFGGRVEITKVFGGPEGLVFGERDDDFHGAGIDDDILQREIERILEPAKTHGSARGGSRLAINVNPSTDFDKITKIIRVQAEGDQQVHREIATHVARHSTRLRGYLEELGLRWLPVRGRTQGRALDRSRLRALVTRNDPRILVARTPIRRTDLFVGTIVDCSGSMQVRNNIDRARRFAVLVAEAVRHLPGVEARFFGFTDSVIYDAGDKDDCHVTALETSGGNNDAAALYHAASVALASKQRAKILIMISDGLPTECSVAALRNLVTELTHRRGIVCAQVAVNELEEVCFPHYVLLDDEQMDVAVAKFGRMIADLARRSLAS